jgi:hypothetical protein
MKILSGPTWETWSTTVICMFCGARLEVTADDLYKLLDRNPCDYAACRCPVHACQAEVSVHRGDSTMLRIPNQVFNCLPSKEQWENSRRLRGE